MTTVAGCDELVEEMRAFLAAAGSVGFGKHARSSSMSENVSQLVRFPRRGKEEEGKTKKKEAIDVSALAAAIAQLGLAANSTPAEYARAAAVLHAILCATAAAADDEGFCGERAVAEVCLWTSRIECLLASAVLAASPPGVPAPRVLRDILDSPVLASSSAAPLLPLLRLLLGPPCGLNLRNVAWHGFLGPGELPSAYVPLLRSVADAVAACVPADAPRRPPVSLARFCAERSAELPLLGEPPTDAEWDFVVHTLLRESFFVVGGRERAFELGLEFLWRRTGGDAATAVDVGLALLLPQLEHCLRRVFVAANPMLPASTMSPDYRRYYTTLDIILGEQVVIIGTTLVARSAAFGTRLATPKFAEEDGDARETVSVNGLRAAIGDGALALLHDLLIHVAGPRLRDAVSHGTLECSTVPRSVSVGMLCSAIVALCARFLPEQIHKQELLKHPRLVACCNAVDGYVSRFHPLAVATSDIASGRDRILSVVRDIGEWFARALSDANEDIVECAQNRGRCAVSVEQVEDALRQLWTSSSPMLLGQNTIPEQLSNAGVCVQVVSRAEQTVRFIADKILKLGEDIRTGSCSRRAQASLWKLCGCADSIAALCSALSAAAAAAVTTQPANSSSSTRRMLDAADRMWAKTQESRWSDSVTQTLEKLLKK